MKPAACVLIFVVFTLVQLIQANEVQIITKEQWQARPPTSCPSLLKFPISRVIIAHTVTGHCTDTIVCMSTVRNIQNHHMNSLGFADIGYNFLIGGDGLVYEGRGWVIQGAHTKTYNKDSIGIALIGNFVENKPTKKQLQATQLLLELGILMNVLNPNYKLYGQCQLIPTASPGDVLYGLIKQWPHWSSII